VTQIPEDLLRELLATFRTEATERLGSANRAMVALEDEPDPAHRRELVAVLFREVHSLKGASGAVGLSDIQELSHQLESLFESAREGESLPPERHDEIYHKLDAIGALVATVAEPVDDGIADLEKFTAGEAVADPDPPAPVEASRSEDPSPSADQSPPDQSPPGERPARISDETVRVATSKLDALMGQVGELMVASSGSERRVDQVADLHDAIIDRERRWREVRPRYRKLLGDLENANGGGATLSGAAVKDLRALLSFVHESDGRDQTLVRDVSDLRHRVRSDQRRFDQVVSALQDEVRRTRMLPMTSVFSTLPRLVRDVARSLGKEVTLEIDGADIEVDRSVLENIKDPLSHLLRNAVDHGIEDPDERVRKGKPRRARIQLLARQKGDAIDIKLTDDGAGIDLRRLKVIAVKKGFVTESVAEGMSDRDATSLIFRSGFTTSPMITDISGRGVGLDVVRDSVEKMNGLIEVSSEAGAGTSFVITLPLSIATTQCLFVAAGEGKFALPVTNVVRIQRVLPDDVVQAEGRDALLVDGRPTPLVHLADVLGVDRRETEGAGHALIVGSAEKCTAFLVEGFEGAQEVVIKALPEPFERVRFAAGATITGAGEVVMILNVGDLTRAARSGSSRTAKRDAKTTVEQKRPVILIADDSIVTRTLEKNILEAAGYDVRIASDGLEAWNVLETAGVDLLVSDIEMPNVDGYVLTEKVRADERFSTLPVVLVTSLDSRAHRERGIEVGADAHIVKHAFSQDRLLDTIQRLI
jgi:two-component system, chemotaxis family, sensor kinase CheA